MLVKHMLAGCRVRGGLHCRKLISNNVLTWFIHKMPESKSASFSENASFWSHPSLLSLRASGN